MGILFYGHDALEVGEQDALHVGNQPGTLSTLNENAQVNQDRDLLGTTVGRVVIFLGPTLPLDEAIAIFPDAEYRPPVAMGDLLSLVDDSLNRRPIAVGIIDGVFYQSLPIWHKEILYALEKGIAVFGASSMGALRAVECAPFGMIGIGDVYKMYASGELTDDDEVALVHENIDGDWKGHSEPMVNLRATIKAACNDHLLSARCSDILLDIAKSLWFPERTIDNILKCAEQRGLSGEELTSIRDVLVNHYLDVKRLDAIELLATMKSLYDKISLDNLLPLSMPTNMTSSDSQKDPLTVVHSLMFDAMSERDRRLERNGISISQEEIVRYVALSHKNYTDLRSRVLDRLLAIRLADIYDIKISEDDIYTERKRLCARLMIRTDNDLNVWLRKNDLTEDAFQDLIMEEARLRKVRDWAYMFLSKRQATVLLLNELKVSGEYVKYADDAAILSKSFPLRSAIDPASTDTSYHDKIIIDQLRSGQWRPDTNVVQYAAEAGFQDVWDLLDELDRHYQLRQRQKKLINALGGTGRIDSSSMKV